MDGRLDRTRCGTRYLYPYEIVLMGLDATVILFLHVTRIMVLLMAVFRPVNTMWFASAQNLAIVLVVVDTFLRPVRVTNRNVIVVGK